MLTIDKQLMERVRKDKKSHPNILIDIFIRPYFNGSDKSGYKAQEWLLNIPNILKDMNYQEHDNTLKRVLFGEVDIVQDIGMVVSSTSDRKVIVPNGIEYAIINLYMSDLSTPHSAGIQIVERIVQEVDVTKILSNTSDRTNRMYKDKRASPNISTDELYEKLKKIKNIR